LRLVQKISHKFFHQLLNKFFYIRYRFEIILFPNYQKD
jgi:hypothetical protein